jgi:hypothetical protein
VYSNRATIPGTATDRRLKATEARIAAIAEHIRQAAAAEADRARRAQLAEEMTHWLEFYSWRRNLSEENARAAQRAFYALAKRPHPDQGGTHQGFLRLKEAYDRALAAYRAGWMGSRGRVASNRSWDGVWSA